MPYNNVIPGWMLEDPKALDSLKKLLGPTEQEQEAEQYLNAVGWEGGAIGLLEYGGPEAFPLPIRWIAAELDRVYSVFKQAEEAYLHRMGQD